MNSNCEHSFTYDKRGNRFCSACGMWSEYPPEWECGAIQRFIRMRAGHRCEGCNMPFHRGTNLAVFHKNSNGRPVVGTVHHIDGVKSNCDFNNLVYLCQRCHLRVQFQWKPGQVIPPTWFDMDGNPPMWILRRGLPYKVESWQMRFI